MYKLENDEYIELTDEDLRLIKAQIKQPLITINQRLEALEQAITDLAIQTMGVDIDE